MASGFAALLDDIAVIAKLAAASLDDVGAAAGKAAVKAAGVVVDDTAVTPRYVSSFTPDRELPVIWRIAKGSLKNKLLFILPAALLLSAFLPWAITPILVIGGAYLCFEGAEKLIEAYSSHETEEVAEDAAAQLSSREHEDAMASGAIRTDLILSAEIMAIALAEVAAQPFVARAAILAFVAVGITAVVYGLVALIVKMDDIGLGLARRERRGSQKLGRGLVKAMPHVLGVLSAVGIAAMIWVGGGIILHGMHEFHLTPLPGLIEKASRGASAAVPFAPGFAGWLVHAGGSLVFGAIVGGIIALIHGKLAGGKH